MQNLIELETVGSTNDHAKALAKSGYPHGTVVFAHEQTAGKGRQGNIWASLKGNLFMSVILRPQMNAALIGQLSFLSAVALAETFQSILPPTARIGLKWPNDVFLNGKKAAGILLESEADGVRPVGWVVIGIGVNITGGPEDAISLKDMGVETDARSLLENLVKRLMSLYGTWLKNGFDPVHQAWTNYAMNIGKDIQVRLPKESCTGKFLGIDKTGALQLEMPDGGRRMIASGEVFL